MILHKESGWVIFYKKDKNFGMIYRTRKEARDQQKIMKEAFPLIKSTVCRCNAIMYNTKKTKGN